MSDDPFSDDVEKQVWEATVGYGHPPVHSRFRKGQSGNPKGRPKKVKPDLSLAEQPLLEQVLKAAARKVLRRENGKVEEITLDQAIIEATLAGATKTNPRSQALAIDLMQQANSAKAEDIRRRNKIWEDYKASAYAELAEAAEQGLPPPKIVPHPDDVDIDPIEGPQFLGPITEEQQAKLERLLQLRDVLIMQEALDERSTTRLDGTPLTEPGSAMLRVMVIDRFVPQRYRLSDNDVVNKLSQYKGTPKRQLLKQLYAAWRDVGIPQPRGYVSPNHTHVRARLELYFDLAHEVLADRVDMDVLGRGEWDETCLGILARHGLIA